MSKSGIPIIIAVLLLVLTVLCSQSFAQDQGQGQALIEAAKRGNLAQVKALLDKGADVNAKGTAGYTALMAAVTFGSRPDVVKLLLERGADINTKTLSGHTPLLIAVASFQSNMARLLLEKGADIDVREPHHNLSPLMIAARNNMGDIAKLLLDKGANINEKGDYHWTALDWSIYGGHAKMVKLLLDKGADVNTKTPYGRTALMEAAEPDHLVKTDMPHSKPERQAQYGPIYPNRSRDLEVVKLLLEHGADVNAKDEDGWTALKRAERRGSREIVELLKAYGAKE